MIAAFSIEQFQDPLVWFGFAGQGIFMTRFLVQWYATEKRRRSYVPIAFWWLSLAGGFSLLLYSWLRSEPVLFFAQMLGLPIYARNLWLIYARRWRTLARLREAKMAELDPAQAA